MRLRREALGIVVIVAALAGTACGGDDDTNSADDASGDAPATSTGDTGNAPEGEAGAIESGIVGDQPDAEPTDGGTLNFAAYAEPSSLDPTVAIGNGTTGGSEMAAIYDTLMRYDPEARDYVPQLAKSIKPNKDSSAFTLKLRPDVEFSDGTPLDAEAVVASIERHTDNQSRFATVVANIKSYKTPDDSTVVFELTDPWPGFPYVLSTSPGMVTSPTAVDKLGDDKFGSAPVGAGPFTVKRYAPGEELVLAANADYWNGKPHLDGVRFVPLQGAETQVDAMKSGEIQGAFLREPAPIADAREEGFPGYRNNQGLGNILLINNGVNGNDRPTSDVRVRQAIAHALDPEVLNQRADQGKGMPSFSIVSESSQLFDQPSTISYDPDKAKQLLEEVKAETGWDGSLDVACSTIPSRATWALAVGGLLDAVGFKTNVIQAGSTADLIERVTVNADYDLACWGFSLDDAVPFEALALNLLSDSPVNPAGYKNDEMDVLIDELKAAPDVAAETEVMNKIQALFDETVPVIPTAATPEFVAWNESVHGIKPSVKTIVLFDEAFIAS